MNDTSQRLRTLLMTVFVAAVPHLVGCSECKKDGDCPGGQRCVQGSCVPISGIDTSTDSTGDVPLDGQDTSGDTPSDTSIDTPIDPVDADTDVIPDLTDPEADALVPCTTDAECDDGNICTEDICHEIGLVCIYQFANGTICDEGDYCDGLDSCQDGVCTPGIPVTCTDPNPCVEGECNESTDSCSWSTVSDGSFCDNGFMCDGADECQEGVCTPTYGVVCNDSSPCTDDSCDWDADACVFTPVTLEVDAVGCGDRTLVLMTGIDDRMNSYDCEGTSYPGHTGETILELTLGSVSTVQLTIETADEDPTIFQTFLLADLCDPGSCAASGDKNLTLAGVSGTVYIVVERDTIGAAYLNIACL